MRLATRLAVTCLTAVVVLAGSAAAPAAAQSAGPPPDSMASLGDSITRAFNSCGWYVDCPSRSFSTGSNSGINSHYLRIRAVNPAIGGNNHNHAESGARIDDLPGQASDAVASDVDYVTILIGANDACTSSEASMTPVGQFRADLDEALGILQAGLPDARVLVISIPNIKQLWEVGRTSFLARTFWSIGNICQSMLDNPTSNAASDQARRDRVQQRVIDYNGQLADACAGYGPNCRFDGNAVFNFSFTLDQVSGWDYFHPNAQGQAMLAGISYQAGFNW